MTPTDLIAKHFRLTPPQKEALARLKLVTLEDLLFYFPHRFARPGDFKRIADCEDGETVTIYAKVSKVETKKGWKSKIPMAEGKLEDESGKLKVLWFHQAYMAKKVPEGTWATFTGKVSAKNGALTMINPDVNGSTTGSAAGSLFNETGTSLIIPIYPETRNLSSGWFYYHLQEILKHKVHEQLADPLPEKLLAKYSLPTLTTALVWLHSPQKLSTAEAAQSVLLSARF
jgi:ATP-dependent DNA helicase RecG